MTVTLNLNTAITSLHVKMGTLDHHIYLTYFIFRGRLACFGESLRQEEDNISVVNCLYNLMVLFFPTEDVCK